MEGCLTYSNFHEVVDNLYIGNNDDAGNKELLKSKVSVSFMLENILCSYCCC